MKKKISSHAHKTRSWYLLGVLFKFPTSSTFLFIWDFPRVTSIIMILCSYVFVLGNHFFKTWGNSLAAGKPGFATGHKIFEEQWNRQNLAPTAAF